MRHKMAGRKLGRNPSHRRSLLRNLVTSFLEHERLVTTLPKAKEVRPLAEKMITLGKRDTLHARRQVQSYLLSAVTTKKVFDTIAPRFSDRPGGYSRIVRLGPRIGDGADVAIIELVGSELAVKKAERAEKEEDKAEQTDAGKGEKSATED
jgi:large subunit ribosomal protein L17